MAENQPTPTVNNPFAPASLRINQDFISGAAVEKCLVAMSVRKPNAQEFVRAHPDENFRLIPAAIIEVKDDREIYLVDPSLADVLNEEINVVGLFTAISKQGTVFLWPVKLPKADGRANAWHASAMAAVQEAMQSWVRVKANMSAGAYDVFKAKGEIPEPQWPDVTFERLLELAFKDDRIIRDLNHAVIKRLQGRA
jgi:hypothetical protein